ncbi:hypothetical protein CEP52_000456 [Fusarium oligoseptatum]|uniref:Uncharacterized protein n=1 Tax=Fusarium oligoseptatum TaxID=2604345 RepID=A0A428UNY1_9HYPO|nr:hypothetical protein CEP52_000456 [Fusarium oligoseptatum]
MSDISGFPPSASDYVLSEDMFIPDVQKATNPRDRARRQRAVRKVVHAFNRAKLSLSLWSLSMLWNYLRTTDWVCGERDVNTHPDGRLLLEQDASSRWPMAWYGRLFVIQATCHKTDQIDKIHREHATHWGCAYHENRPFYPDIYPGNSKNSHSPGSEYSVAPSTFTLDSGYSQEHRRGRSPPRPKSQSPTPTLADYDIVDPLHLEEAMPPAAVNQQTRPARASPEVPPAQAYRARSPLKKPTQTACISPKASPPPSHAGPTSSSSLLKQPEDPVYTDRWDDFSRFRARMPGSYPSKSPAEPARAGPKVPSAQVDRAVSPLLKKPTHMGRTSRKASPRPSQPVLASSSALKQPAYPVHTDRWDGFNHVFTRRPSSYLPKSPTQPAHASHEVPRPTQVDPTMPPPINQPVDPVRTNIWKDLIPASGPDSYSLWSTQPTCASPEASRSAKVDPTIPPPRSQTAVPSRTSSEVTPRPGHVGLALPPSTTTNPVIGFTGFEEDQFRSMIPSQFRPCSSRGHRPMHVHGPPSIVTNPPSLRACPPHFGDMPSLRLGPNPRSASSVMDTQSCIIQATQAAQEAIELSQRSLHHVQRLEAFSSSMSNFIQQSVTNAEWSRNFMESSAVTTKGMKDDIRGSKANIEAAVTTANRALGLVEKLSQYFATKPGE